MPWYTQNARGSGVMATMQLPVALKELSPDWRISNVKANLNNANPNPKYRALV